MKKRSDNMKKGMILALALLLGVFMGWVAADKQMPPTDGASFWTYIKQTKPYTEWKHWPGYEDMYPAESPHGAFLKLFVNDKALQAIEEGQMPLPPGSIIVKENYGDDKTLMAVTPMYKAEGYNPEAGDWFWAKYGAEGEVMASGKVQACIDCHKKKKDKDWLFTE
jgi:hypothetical protein